MRQVNEQVNSEKDLCNVSIWWIFPPWVSNPRAPVTVAMALQWSLTSPLMKWQLLCCLQVVVSCLRPPSTSTFRSAKDQAWLSEIKPHFNSKSEYLDQCLTYDRQYSNYSVDLILLKINLNLDMLWVKDRDQKDKGRKCSIIWLILISNDKFII